MMSERYYSINGMDDVNLKQAYLQSLPDPLGSEVLQGLNSKGATLQHTSLGRLEID